MLASEIAHIICSSGPLVSLFVSVAFRDLFGVYLSQIVFFVLTLRVTLFPFSPSRTPIPFGFVFPPPPPRSTGFRLLFFPVF